MRQLSRVPQGRIGLERLVLPSRSEGENNELTRREAVGVEPFVELNYHVLV